LEPFEWEELDDNSNNELKSTDNNTEDVLISVQRLGFDNLTSEFNHEHLDDDGENCDLEEQWVSKYSTEDVHFHFELSSIELVEDLHENEGLEDKGKVEKFLCVVTCWLLQWSVLFLIDFIFCKELVNNLSLATTFKFGFLILIEFLYVCYELIIIMIFFSLSFSVEFTSILGKQFLIKIFSFKIISRNCLFLPPFNIFMSCIVIRGIIWVVRKAFEISVSICLCIKLKAWNIVVFAKSSLA